MSEKSPTAASAKYSTREPAGIGATFNGSICSVLVRKTV